MPHFLFANFGFNLGRRSQSSIFDLLEVAQDVLTLLIVIASTTTEALGEQG